MNFKGIFLAFLVICIISVLAYPQTCNNCEIGPDSGYGNNNGRQNNRNWRTTTRRYDYDNDGYGGYGGNRGNGGYGGNRGNGGYGGNRGSNGGGSCYCDDSGCYGCSIGK